MNAQNATNVFCINGVEEVFWTHVSFQAKKLDKETISSVQKESLIHQYVELLSQGYPVLWTYDKEDSKQQDLWIFKIGTLRAIAIALRDGLREVESGVWRIQTADPRGRLTRIFFKALHNKIAWLMHLHSFVLMGDCFVTSRQHMIPSLPSCLCMKVVVRKNRLQSIANADIPREPTIVLASPYCLVGNVNNGYVIEKDRQVKEDWKTWFNLHNLNDDVVGVAIGNARMKFPVNTVYKYVTLEPAMALLNHWWRKGIAFEFTNTSAFSKLHLNDFIQGEVQADGELNEQLKCIWNCENNFDADGTVHLMPPQNIGTTSDQVGPGQAQEIESPSMEQPELSDSSPMQPPTPQELARENMAPHSPSNAESDKLKGSKRKNRNEKENGKKGSKTKKHKPQTTQLTPSQPLQPTPQGYLDQPASMEDDMLGDWDDKDFESWIQSTEKKAATQPPEQTPMELKHPSVDQEETPLSSLQEKDLSPSESMLSPTTELPDECKPSLLTVLESIQETKQMVVQNEWVVDGIPITVQALEPKVYVCPANYSPVEYSRARAVTFGYAYSPANAVLEENSYSPVYRIATPVSTSNNSQPLHIPVEQTKSENGTTKEDSDASGEESAGSTDSGWNLNIQQKAKLSTRVNKLCSGWNDSGEYRSALLNLLLSGIPQQSLDWEESHGTPCGNCSSEQLELVQQLSSASADGLAFADVNNGLLTNLGVNFWVKLREKHLNMEWIDSMFQPHDFLSTLAATEEPNSGSLDMAIDPINYPTESTSQDVLRSMIHSLQPTLSQFGRGMFELNGPLTLQEWSNLHSRQGLESQMEHPLVEKLPVPNILVGYQGNWISIPPNSLAFWDKLRLEPYAPKKDILYYVVAPNMPQILPSLIPFFKELSCMYEVCNLGHHQEDSTYVPNPNFPGFSLVSMDSATDELSWLTLEQHYKKECSSLVAHMIKASCNYLEASCTVLYIINPFGNSPAAKLIFNCLCDIIKETSESFNINLTLQTIPLHHILQGTDLMITLKELAFSVFAKARRISTPEALSYGEETSHKQLKLYEPLFILTGVQPQTTPTLHCCYILSDQAKHVVATFTDDHGELLESIVMPFDLNTNNGIVARLWRHCKQIATNNSTKLWNVVIGKFGVLTPTEIEAWQTNTSNSISNIHTVTLVSAEFDHSLQIILDHEPTDDPNSCSWAMFPNISLRSPLQPVAISYIVSPIPNSLGSPTTQPRMAKLLLSLYWSHSFGFSDPTEGPRQILRTITQQYHALSWLNVSSYWPQRQSTLPLHLLVAKRIARFLGVWDH